MQLEQIIRLAERLARHSIPEPNSGCWLWFGARDTRGYGQLRIAEKTRYATHVSMHVAGRPLAPGEQALHRCDNPACINPDHLFAGRPRDNVQDMIAKGRHNFRGLDAGRGWNRGQYQQFCHRGHAQTSDIVYVSPMGARFCRICRQINKKRRRLR